MRILHVVQYDLDELKGGIQRYVNDLAYIQSKAGHSVTIFSCAKRKAILHKEQITIKRFSYFEIFRTPISIGMLLASLVEKYDIIHLHIQFPIVAEIIGVLAKIKNKPIVVTYHNEIDLLMNTRLRKISYFIWSRTLLKLLLKISDAIIVTTRNFAATSTNLKYVSKEKIYVIPCGILLNKIAYAQISNTKHTNKITDGNYILYVGRLKPEKGIHLLLEAISMLKKDGIKIQLYIVGEASRKDEIEYKIMLEQIIQSLNINEFVKFFENVSDEMLPNFYFNAKALVLPSLSRLEGFGIVQLEAMAHSTPLIVSNIDGPNSVAKEAAIFVEPNNVKELYVAIKKIINDYNLRGELANNAFKKAREYDWNILYKEIEKVYRKVLR